MKDPMSGYAKIAPNEKPSEKAPVYKGYITITPEMLSRLMETKPNQYGDRYINVALWYSDKEEGALTGKSSLLQPRTDIDVF